MKTNGLLIVSLFTGLWLASCNVFFLEPSYKLELPPLPEVWAGSLPAPQWRIERVDREGRREAMEVTGDRAPPLALPREYANAVLAFPYWPEQNLPPGVMRPAGAIVPFDLRGDTLPLSWRGGAEAWIYREMAAALADGAEGAPPQRRPELFDWPRFRELLEDPVVPEEVRRDPWTADWTAICRKTIQSGFDRRRIKAETRKDLVIPGFGGYWIGTSPFAEPVVQETGGPLRLRIGGSPETFVSSSGVLRCTGNTWLWTPFYGD